MNVRRVVPGDEERLRAVRLAALADSPAAFASTYEREVAFTPERWRQWVSSGATYFVDGADGEPVGLVAVAKDRDDATAARVLSMWLHPAARGTGAADGLMEAVLTWARQARFPTAKVCVMEGNLAALRLYERHGFRLTGPSDDSGELQMERSLTS